ncbi:MAG: hypothetical protein H7222_09160 [Methylotenera sp.]|nr:hypothetical protein [Oligoflexia bacterium]
MKLHSRLAVVLVILSSSFLSSFRAEACDFCMLGQGVSPYLTATGKGLTLGINSQELDKIYNKSTAIDSLGKKEYWLLYSLTGFFPVTDDLTVLITLPYSIKTNIEFESASNSNPGTLTSGIADATLTGRYTVLRDHTLESTFIVGLLGGIKLPTGTTGNRNRTGEPVDRRALPGTGSWDFDLGFSASLAKASGFQLTLDSVYRISTTGKWNERDHRYGNTLNYSTKGYYRVAQTQGGSSFMPFFGVSGETTAREVGLQTDTDYFPGTKNPSTGGTVLYGNVGLYSILSPTTLVNFGFSKALYHHMHYDADFDADPAENYKLDFSITYLF